MPKVSVTLTVLNTEGLHARLDARDGRAVAGARRLEEAADEV